MSFQKPGEAAIAATLRETRMARGWSLRAAAAQLGVSVRFLHELERGKASVRLDKLVQVLEGLGLALKLAPRQAVDPRDEVRARKPLLKAIAAKHGVRSLALFGSAARGEAGAASDLDFLVEMEDGRSLVDLVGVKQDLEALFGRPVDAFTRASLKPGVRATAQADLLRVL
ncbi:MAG: nucleotidyltransferase domain-containing protein [Burkholderiales bacterium]|nr:nucleotidyltransferase domain-containing protein [Burkholderiales bacterium]